MCEDPLQTAGTVQKSSDDAIESISRTLSKSCNSGNHENSLYNIMMRHGIREGRPEVVNRWLNKFDGGPGRELEIGNVNARILAAAKAHDFATVEDWLVKVTEPGLHRQLNGLQPTAETFDIIIRHSAEAGDLARCTSYIGKAKAFGIQPGLNGYLSMIRAFVHRGEARQAHSWLAALVEEGCGEEARLRPEVVQGELLKPYYRRRWDVNGLIRTIKDVVGALAGIGNAQTADRWLRYLLDSGIEPEDSPETWERVRAVHPEEIVPAVLSAEAHAAGLEPTAPLTRPALLSGEDPCPEAREPAVHGRAARSAPEAAATVAASSRPTCTESLGAVAAVAG